MSKFSNRNRQNFELHNRSKSLTGNKSKKRSLYGIRNSPDLQRNSQQEVFSTEQKITQVNKNSELLDSKFAYKSEKLSSETLNLEEAIAEEKEDAPHAYSDNLSKRSQDIDLEAQIAEVELLIKRGLKYYQQKNYRQCISNLEQALNADRENVKTNYWLGMSYYQLLQMDKALKYFIRVSPSNCESGYVETFFWIGEIYRQQQKLSEASENYQKLLSLAPNSTYSALALEHLTTIKFKTLFG